MEILLELTSNKLLVGSHKDGDGDGDTLFQQRQAEVFEDISHSDLGNKPLPISFLGSGLVFLLHSGLPLSSSVGLAVCLRIGKENGVNILKLIDEGPFQMGTFQETLAKGNKGALHLGPERARVYSDLSHDDKDRYNVNI
ncbi:hypothetical protein Tco_1424311 [Tanacetum coccineum]